MPPNATVAKVLLLWYDSRMFLWAALQSVIFLAVVSANIYWELTPNPLVAVMVGAALAYGVTRIIVHRLEGRPFVEWKRPKAPS
jgi:hypothetical protein